MSDLSKSENEIYSLRKEKEQKIKDSKFESFQTSFKNSTPIEEEYVSLSILIILF